MSLVFVSTKKVRQHIRKRKVFPEDLMYSIQKFFIEKNEASKIKYVRFTISNVIEEDKRVRRSLEVEVCSDTQISNEKLNKLNEMLAREFPSLNASVRIHCEE